VSDKAGCQEHCCVRQGEGLQCFRQGGGEVEQGKGLCQREGLYLGTYSVNLCAVSLQSLLISLRLVDV
jgi:hypothetical protein